MTEYQQADQALTFAYDYHPGVPFRVIARLPQVVVRRILGGERDGEPVIRNTAGYDAYLAAYRVEDVLSEYVLVFVEGALRQGQRYTFGTPVVFESRLNLIEVEIGPVGGRLSHGWRKSSG